MAAPKLDVLRGSIERGNPLRSIVRPTTSGSAPERIDVVTAAYWCNPAIWFAARRVRGESERACDERVPAGGTTSTASASLLVRVAAEARRPLPRLALAVARARELERRLVAVLDDRRPRTAPTRTGVALASLAGLVLAVPTAALTVAQAAGPVQGEPDQRGDMLAGPMSERVPLTTDDFVLPASKARQLLDGPDAALARTLMGALSREPAHEADLVRERAWWALNRAWDGRLVEALLDALTSSDWREQAYSAWALALAPSDRVVERLLPLMDHEVWRARAIVAHALRTSGDERAVDAMRRALEDPAWQVRLQAVQYFGQLGSRWTSLVRPRMRDRHAAVRIAAQQILSH